MEQPDIIKVGWIRREEVQADRADLFVTIKGVSLFTGQEALKKAREVAQFVSELTSAGLPQDAIFLQGVFAETASGMVLKASQATYRLRVHCTKLEMLADILGIITAQKNAALESIAWGYPDDAETKVQWLMESLQRIKGKAQAIAGELGVTLLGVHQFVEKYDDPEAGRRTHSASEWLDQTRARRMTSEDLGLEVSHTKTVELHLEVQYRVSAFAQEPGTP